MTFEDFKTIMKPYKDRYLAAKSLKEREEIIKEVSIVFNTPEEITAMAFTMATLATYGLS